MGKTNSNIKLFHPLYIPKWEYLKGYDKIVELNSKFELYNTIRFENNDGKVKIIDLPKFLKNSIKEVEKIISSLNLSNDELDEIEKYNENNKTSLLVYRYFHYNPYTDKWFPSDYENLDSLSELLFIGEHPKYQVIKREYEILIFTQLCENYFLDSFLKNDKVFVVLNEDTSYAYLPFDTIQEANEFIEWNFLNKKEMSITRFNELTDNNLFYEN